MCASPTVPSSAIRAAGKSQLLRLVRQRGMTAWVFAETEPARGMRFEHDAPYGQCVGTLRWSEQDSFPRLPAWPLTANEPIPPLKSWRHYLEMRLPPDGDGTIRVQPPLLDGLSYPVTLLFALQQLQLQPPSPGPLTILVVGASSKAEERLMRESTYWLELTHHLRGIDVNLVFVGPEINPSRHGKSTCHGALILRCFHGTLGDLFRAEPHHSAENTIVIGFNTGMGNTSAGMAKGGFVLMQSWLPDLVELLRLGMVGIFTCANDYSDLRGELSIFVQLLAAEMVLPPMRNPFKAATIVRESDSERCEWSCSSCFLYAIRGRSIDTPALPGPTDADGMSQLVANLNRLAKQLSHTQKVTPVP